MRPRIGSIALLVLASCALAPAAAWARPASGPRETVDQRFSTPRPGTATGVSFSARFHSAGNHKGNPPYLRRMVIRPPKGFRYDTSAPARCSAPDVALQALGPDACPPASRIGTGSVTGIFYEPIRHDFIFDRYWHHVDVVNNTNEQIVLVHAEGYAVARGHLRPDGSIEFEPPTCFPTPPTGCVDDYVRQLSSSSVIPAYTRKVGGRVRSYATTPPTCPASGQWATQVRLWWANGAVDSVVTKQPCGRRRSAATD